MRLMLTAIALTLAGASVAAAGDLTAGKKAFAKCKVCHAVGPGAKNKIGPTLNGVVGRPWGTVEGFKYSKDKEGTLLAIIAAEPRTWDVETLTAYIRKPKDVIPKGKMSMAGLKKDEDIENLIFYLAQFDENGEEVDPQAVLSALEEASN